MEQNLGLPEGVELIDFKAAGAEDFELSRGIDGELHIYQGARLGGAGASFRIKPANGYEFVQIGAEQVADIKAFETRNGRPRFQAVKKLAPQVIHVAAVFLISNQIAADAIHAKYDEMRQLAGFQGENSSITTTPIPQPTEPAA